jgi:hypothetical protein
MHAFFLSEQGILNREVKSAKEKLAKILSDSKMIQFPLSNIGSASEALAKINLDQTPTHMDLLLELLCSLVVSDPDGAAAQLALGVLQRFLLPLQSLGASLCLADTVNGVASLTDRHLDRYMGMVEQLFVRGSPATREMAADCLLGIATARGGLRHLSRAATFLQTAGCQISQAATASVDRVLGGVDCALDSDAAWACADNGLGAMLAGAWSKCVPQGQKVAGKGTVCGLKVLVLSLVRLLASRCLEAPPPPLSSLSHRPSLCPSVPPSFPPSIFPFIPAPSRHGRTRHQEASKPALFPSPFSLDPARSLPLSPPLLLMPPHTLSCAPAIQEPSQKQHNAQTNTTLQHSSSSHHHFTFHPFLFCLFHPIHHHNVLEYKRAAS